MTTLTINGERRQVDVPANMPLLWVREAGATASIPALRNAIYAATGVALRRMPVDRNLLATTHA